MLTLKSCIIFLSVSLFFTIKITNTKTIPEGYYYKGDAVITHWPTTTEKKILENRTVSQEPGWARSQLLKFGQVASKIGNAMGAHATKITAAIDKVCEVIKTVIPLLAAVCHVGQFKFCAATNDAPVQLSEAVNPSFLDLDSLDK